MILKSWNMLLESWISFNSDEKLGHDSRSPTIAITSFQSVPKYWHVEWCNMLSIVHWSASNSICNGDSLFSYNFCTRELFCPSPSTHVHPHPLYKEVEVQEPSTKKIHSKREAYGGITGSRCTSFVATLVMNHAWHSSSAYIINSKESLSVPIDSL